MKKLSVLFESINPSEAYQDFDAMMTVLRGRRSVAFLMGPTVDEFYEKHLKNNDSVGLMRVKRDGHGLWGDGYILYNDINKAKRLHMIMSKHDGYLSDDTPEEAIENGEALEYHDEDIKSFTEKRYGEGSYDKVKNYEKAR